MHACRKTLFAVLLLSSSIAKAGEIGGTLGVSYEFGQLGDSGMSENNRYLMAQAIEGLPGYWINPDWLVGFDLGYRFQEQTTSVANASGTNLSGQAWTVGIGGIHRFTPHFSLQAALNLLGQYSFQHQTDHSEGDGLRGLIGVGVKAQYFCLQNLPLSFDLVGDYQNWSTFNVSGNSNSQPASQWMLGVGVTYFLGGRTVAAEAPAREAPTAPLSPSEKPGEPLAALPPTPAPSFHVEGTAFTSGQAELSNKYKQKLETFGKNLNADQRVTVVGYTDASGPKVVNQRLSQQRADAVKAALVAGGVAPEHVTAVGKGDENPVADNSTSGGRAKNRRVEIQLAN